MRDLPFVPAWLDDAGLSLSEFRVYMHVCRRSNGGRVDCNAEVATMAATCCMRLKTVRAALRTLEARGLLEQTPRPGKTSERRPLVPNGRGAEGDPWSQTGGVPFGTPGPKRPSPLVPNDPDPSPLGVDEGAFEGAFEGAGVPLVPNGRGAEGDSWGAIADELRVLCPEHLVPTHIRGTRASVVNGVLVVRAPSQLTLDWLKGNRARVEASAAKLGLRTVRFERARPEASS